MPFFYIKKGLKKHGWKGYVLYTLYSWIVSKKDMNKGTEEW